MRYDNIRRFMIRGMAMLWIIQLSPSMACMSSMAEWRNKMEDIQWGEITEGLAISISTIKPGYKKGEAISLNIAMKNFDEDPVPIVVRSIWIDYAIKVLFEHTTEIPKSTYALQKIEAAGEGRRATSELKPGEILHESLELTKAYDMTVPGTYTVIVSRETYQKGKLDRYAVVKSNELTIKVVP
jgi:hypothetical protein